MTIYHRAISKYGAPVVIKLSKHTYPPPWQYVQFANEYALTKDLDIPQIRKARETGSIDGRLAIILDYVEGETVWQAFVAQRKSLDEILTMAIDIARALGEMHRFSIIHKNINSRHILVNRQERGAVFIDFTIASKLDIRKRYLGISEVLEGSLAYISPEQTGRMNRLVDCRTDFYSLGVVLYEMLCEKLPFDATDPLQLIHCHIAKRPEVVREINPNIPQAVSDLVMKLMAKDADDRYQSAFGLMADLENCRKQLRQSGAVPGFQLAKEDISGRLSIPQKLYERESEIQTLIRSFERVTQGASGIVLVLGCPGVGKTELVNELCRFVAEKKGYFILGKQNQYQRNIPYYALIQAFSGLIKQMLAEGEHLLAQLKESILKEVGDYGQVLIKAIPSLEWIIGRQPPVLESSLVEEQQSFLHAFQKLVRAIAHKDRPLVLFIDNLQWMDIASWNLINLLMTDSSLHYLLFIGAYRDKEMEHSALTTIDDWRQKELIINTIRLENLAYGTVSRLISDALRCDPSDTESLVDLVFEKSGGNAFFVTEYLQSLYEEEFLIFCYETQRWKWDITKIREKAVTEDVASLLIQKIDTLPENTREILMLAACLGEAFTLNMLAAVAKLPVKTTFDILWKAVEERLVLPLDNNYKALMTLTEEHQPAVECFFEFSHSRLRQATYSLIPIKRKRALHLKIGRLLLTKREETEIETSIFDIVDHFNEGFRYIQEESEKLRVVKLNLLAGRKAKNTGAFQAAIRYFSMGIGLLPYNKWESCYDLTRYLYEDAIEAEYLCSNYERVKLLSNEALQHIRDIQSRISIYKRQIQIFTTQKQDEEALEAALTALETIGDKMLADLTSRPHPTLERPVLVDTATIIKASHMLSQEIHLKQLLDKIMRIVIENAGAEKGVLIENKEHKLIIQAIGQVEPQQVETMQSLPVEKSGKVPISVLNYVAHTHTPVVLSDASQSSAYAGDQYIADHQIKSLLCLPIVHKANLLGLLYLENNLATNVFTPDRLELLQVLSSQAAISMENANLYASLEENIRDLKNAEQARKDSERRLADTINFLPEATFAIDQAGKVILWNKAAEEFTGVSAEKMLGKGEYEYAIPFYGKRRPILIDLLSNPEPEIEQLYENFKRVGSMIIGEFYIHNTGRGKVYLSAIASYLYDSDGNIIGQIESIRDITEGKRAEEEIKNARRQLDRTLKFITSVISAVPIPLFYKDKEGRYLGVNDAFAELLGFTPDYYKGKTVMDLWPSDFAEIYHKKDLELMSNPVKQVYEFTVLDKNGVVRPTIWNKHVFRDENGQVAGIVGAFQDISERKRAEEALKRSEERYRSLYEDNPSMYFTVDPSGRVLSVNQFGCDQLGYTAQELIGQSVLGVFHDEDKDAAKKYVMHSVENLGQVFHWELRKVHRSGSVMWVKETARAIQEPNGQIIVYIVCEDITERKKAEEEKDKLQAQLLQAQKMEAIGTLAGGVAHDFNNMLLAILGYAEMIINKMDTENPFFSNLQQIKKAGERAADVTRQLLTFSRKQTVNKKVINFNETVEGMLKMLNRLLGENIRLTWLPGDNLARVEIDPSQIDQILVNLCVNARDAIKDTGKIILETTNTTISETYCATHADFIPGDYILLSVSDNGCGMGADILDKIFEPFFTTKEVGKGTGLGLSTVYGIVKQNKGFINVYSEPDRGTTFSIYLPQYLGDEGRTQIIKDDKETSLCGTETILLVEDEPAILELTTTILKEQGYNVYATSSPLDAICIAKQHAGQIDLLLTDLIMPDMNGRDLAQNLDNYCPNLKHLLMSGYTADAIKNNWVLDTGVNYIQKPFALESFLKKIREVLDMTPR